MTNTTIAHTFTTGGGFFDIPTEITTPCLKNPEIFQTPALDPPLGLWFKVDNGTKKKLATKKSEAERLAVQSCYECPLLAQCEQWSENKEIYGVVGGLTAHERSTKLSPHHTPAVVNIFEQHPADIYLQTGEIVDLYSYIDNVIKHKYKIPYTHPEQNFTKQLTSVIKDLASCLDMEEKTIKDVIKVNKALPPEVFVLYAQQKPHILVRKLLKKGLSTRLIMQRLDVSEHYVRKIKNEKFISRKKRLELHVENVHNLRWNRLSRTTKLVYDFVLKETEDINQRRTVQGTITHREVAQQGVTKEVIMATTLKKLSKEDKIKAVQKKRRYSSEEARLLSGGRRGINHALSLGVRTGVLIKTCEEKVDANRNNNKVYYYQFNPTFVDEWKKYRHKNLNSAEDD